MHSSIHVPHPPIIFNILYDTFIIQSSDPFLHHQPRDTFIHVTHTLNTFLHSSSSTIWRMHIFKNYMMHSPKKHIPTSPIQHFHPSNMWPVRPSSILWHFHPYHNFSLTIWHIPPSTTFFFTSAMPPTTSGHMSPHASISYLGITPQSPSWSLWSTVDRDLPMSFDSRKSNITLQQQSWTDGALLKL